MEAVIYRKPARQERGVEWKWRPAAWAQAARVWESRELKGKSVGRGWCRWRDTKRLAVTAVSDQLLCLC